jgi:hypothetical protein
MASFMCISDYIVIERASDDMLSPITLRCRSNGLVTNVTMTSDEILMLGYCMNLIAFKRTRKVPMDPSWGEGYKEARPAPEAVADPFAEDDELALDPPAKSQTRPPVARPAATAGCAFCLDECDGSCL